MNKNLTKLLFFLAFIEGGAVMCVELCGAKNKCLQIENILITFVQ